MRALWWILALGSALACAGVPGGSGTSTSTTDDGVVSGSSPAEVVRKRAGTIDFDAMESVSGRYIVKLKSGTTVDSSGKVFGGNGSLNRSFLDAKLKNVRSLNAAGDTVAVDTDENVDGIANSDDVEWIEPVRRWKVMGLNDPEYKYQWNMQELHLDEVYARTQGQGVVVAVVDSGVSPGPDGPKNMIAGRDVLDNDNDASDTAAGDSSSGSHGTHVSGTIAETTNNGVGVAGIAPMASIMPVRVGDYAGVYSDDIAEGITWAVDHGAQVMNISIGGYSASKAVEEACKKAYDKGVVIVAASGNDGYDDRVAYPGAYDHVIAVGAHDYAGNQTSYSNHGPQLALLAPGGDSTDLNKDGKPDGILQSTIVGGKHEYVLMSGTSMASPHVTGTVALLIASGVKGPDAIRNALLNGAKVVNGVRELDILGALDMGAKGGGPPVAGTGPSTPTTPGAPTPPTAPGAPGGQGPHAGRPGARPGMTPPTAGTAPSVGGHRPGAGKPPAGAHPGGGKPPKGNGNKAH